MSARKRSGGNVAVVGPMILWMSMLRMKTLVDFQKRVMMTKMIMRKGGQEGEHD
jgi:hypothetical protein